MDQKVSENMCEKRDLEKSGIERLTDMPGVR
jgi:hypothetical protein